MYHYVLVAVMLIASACFEQTAIANPRHTAAKQKRAIVILEILIAQQKSNITALERKKVVHSTGKIKREILQRRFVIYELTYAKSVASTSSRADYRPYFLSDVPPYRGFGDTPPPSDIRRFDPHRSVRWQINWRAHCNPKWVYPDYNIEVFASDEWRQQCSSGNVSALDYQKSLGWEYK